MAAVRLTAKKIDSRTLARPKRVTLDLENVVINGRSGGVTKISESNGKQSHTYEVYETPAQIAALSILSSTDMRSKQHITLGASAAGTNQGAGTAIGTGKVLTEATTVTDSSAEGVRLPQNPTVGDVRTCINNGAGTLKVYPGSGDYIKESGTTKAVNVHATVGAGAEKTFVCEASDVWTVADE
jgi:hypothetical protein